MKLKCLICGKIAYNTNKPQFIDGKEAFSSVICSEKCKKIYIATVEGEVNLRRKL